MTRGLYVRRIGQGARRVLAFHCSLAHSGTWRGLAAEFDNDVTLIAPDMYAHGQSPDLPVGQHLQEAMVDAASTLLDQPTDLWGHSFGGAIALRLALRKPELVRSIVLFEPILLAVAVADAPDLAEADRAAGAS